MAIGRLIIELRTATNSLPVDNAIVRIKVPGGETLYELTVSPGTAGNTEPIELEAPDEAETFDPNSFEPPYSSYDIEVLTRNFAAAFINGVKIFANTDTLLPVDLLPHPATFPETLGPQFVDIGPHNLRRPAEEPSGEPLPEPAPGPQIHEEPFIPEFITVHLGAPTNRSARNVTVRFPDYIANVASCEIYPTWPLESLRANIFAQISLTLNRIYTEWYRSRGYSFDITNSTAYDQYFVYGGNVFENIRTIVNDIFNIYIRKPGREEPFYAEYCNGTTVTCPGMSQWGTVTLANQGYTAVSILENYYGTIELVENNNIRGGFDSYPGVPLRLGASGSAVREIQEQLNRIAVNYPLIPLIAVDGVYGPGTQRAVITFQKIFNLPQDGVVGKGTWYEISRIYVGVKKLAELNSEGQRPSFSPTTYPGFPIKRGAQGTEVSQIQLFLSTIAQYNSAVINVTVDGIFGETTYNSVVSFQREYGLPADGVVGKETWDKLVDVYEGIQKNVSVPEIGAIMQTKPYPGSPVFLGMTGDNVLYIQQILNRLTPSHPQIPKVTEDGIFGNATKTSVIAFQNLFNLTPDGIVGEVTWNTMNEVYERDVVNEIPDLGLRPYPGTVLKVGSSGNDVTYVQRILNTVRTQYESIPIVLEDGYYGNLTKAAVVTFQSLFRLSADGAVGKVTWDTLNNMYQSVTGGCIAIAPYPNTALRLGSSGANVVYLQIVLNRIATIFSAVQPVTVDGFFGPATEESVRNYQTIAGLTADGIVGRETWNRMNNAYETICSAGGTPAGELAATILAQASGPVSADGEAVAEVSAEAEPVSAGGEAVAEASAAAEPVSAVFKPGRPFEKTLRIGTVNNKVSLIKNRLLEAGYLADGTKIDNIFGISTKRAVEAFQEDRGLPVSGRVDEDTWNALFT